MSDIGRLVLERLERDGTLDAYDVRALGGLLESQEAESVMLGGVESDLFVARERIARLETLCSGRIESTVRAAVEVEVLIDAAEALVGACGHGDGEPVNGRYTGVRTVELDAFASALAAVRRTKEA